MLHAKLKQHRGDHDAVEVVRNKAMEDERQQGKDLDGNDEWNKSFDKRWIIELSERGWTCLGCISRTFLPSPGAASAGVSLINPRTAASKTRHQIHQIKIWCPVRDENLIHEQNVG